ncbi:MAG: hypothetical protein QHH30_02085 [candidate division NC10 bacterium]|nr:hypothetical protein [candidate division NC10 bacterium]
MLLRGLIFVGLVLFLALPAFAQEASIEIFLARDSLNSLFKALEGTTVSYQGKSGEELQAGRLLIGPTRILRMGEGEILVGLEGNIWIHYRPRPEENSGIPWRGSMEFTPQVDFTSELSLIPVVDDVSKKLILRTKVSALKLKKAEGIYDLLILMPGVEQIVRSQINQALQDMKMEILDLSPYLIPQEFALQQARWKADRTLIIEPREVKVEVTQGSLKIQASAAVQSKATEQAGN